MRYLSAAEYESILHLGLRRVGLSDTDAANLIAARWPMDAHGLVGEAHGRGLAITTDDIGEWLQRAVGDVWPDGSPVDARSAVFSARVADECLRWCVESGRATSTLAGRLFNANSWPVDTILRAEAAKAGRN